MPETSPLSQWAIFLRNQDELDLGRLSREEREECFAEFAPEPEMQLYGRGIRRALAPLDAREEPRCGGRGARVNPRTDE